MKKWIFRIIKISFFIAIFLFVIFTVLSRLGGNTDVLKGSIEQYLSEISGYKATVGKLNTMQFFPDIIVDIENTEFQNADAQIVMIVEKAKIAISFFDVTFATGRWRALAIENFYVAPDIWMPAPVLFKTIGLEDKADGQGRLIFNGRMGVSDFSGFAAMDVSGPPVRRLYQFGPSWNFEVLLADMALRGTVQKNPGADLKVEPLSLIKNKQPILSGWIDIERMGLEGFGLGGRLEIQPQGSVLMPDVKVNLQPFTVSGALGAEKLVYEDFISAAPLAVTSAALASVFANGAERSGWHFPSGLDLQTQSNHFEAAGVNWGSVSGTLTSQDQALQIRAFSGKILGGDLSGDFEISNKAEHSKLSVEMKISGLPYLKTESKNVGTQGAARLTLASESKNAGDLEKNMTGTLVLVGGEGAVPAAALEAFGAGFLKSFLPGAGPEAVMNLNCTVMGFDIADQKMQAKSIFVDAKEFSITGQGLYNLSTQKADFMLEPKAKSGGFGFVDTAVNVTGALNTLVAKPSKFGSGSGGLAKGAKNPDFVAPALQGIDLAADHPCKQFVIESEVLAPPVFEKTAP